MITMDVAALRDPGRCPDCAAVLPQEPLVCPQCGLPLRGPLVERLWNLSQQAAATLELRQRVIEALRGRVDTVPTGDADPGWAAAPVTVGAPPPSDRAWQPGPRTVPPERERVSPRQIQQLLLGLGVLLLSVAALIFVVVAWSRIDIGGRTAILVGVTAASAFGTRLAARRDLSSTAEALAVLTVGLLLLDAYGAREYDFLGAEDAAADLYWAGAFAGLAVVGLLVRRALDLRTPVWVAALAVQAPVPILGDRLGPTGICVALVVQGTAALAAVGRFRPSPAFLAPGLMAWWAGGIGIVGVAYGRIDEDVTPAGGSGLMLLTAVCAAVLAWDRRSLTWLATPAAGVATAALLLAAHAPMDRSLDPDVATAAGVALLMVVSALIATVPDDAFGELTPRLRLGPLVVLAIGAAAAALDVAEPVGAALAGAFHHISDPWQFGVDADALERLGEPWPFHGAVGFTVVLLTAAAAVLTHRLRGTGAGVVAVGATAFGAVVIALVVPVAIRAPYLLGVLGLIGIGVAILVVAARLLPNVAEAVEGHDKAAEADLQLSAVLVIAGGTGIGTGVAWSLAASTATAWALGFLAASAVGSRGLIPIAARPRATVLASAAVIAEAGVLARIADTSVPAAGTAAVAMAGVLAVAARVLPDKHERIALEATCLLAAFCAAPALGEDSHWTAIALLIAGVAAAVVAMDPARRPVGWLSGVLLTGSSWARLADANVETPEAYTLPPAIALVIVGVLAQRRNAELSSWRTFGPGLALAMLPTLLVTLDDDGLARPLLLGAGALLVLLVGVAARLQAPLALGAATLAIDAIIQIGPYAEAVPRWVSIGAAGVLLLALGTTFERRLRDVRRLAVRFAGLG